MFLFRSIKSPSKSVRTSIQVQNRKNSSILSFPDPTKKKKKKMATETGKNWFQSAWLEFWTGLRLKPLRKSSLCIGSPVEFSSVFAADLVSLVSRYRLQYSWTGSAA